MADELELVQFVTSEIGDDFIVSFFVAEPHDPGLGRSIILMRDKKWEHLIAEGERGVKVSDEDFAENDEAEDNYLEGIRIGDTVAEIETTHRRYRLDLRHVGKSEMTAAKKILKKMNYDERFKLTIA
jgi:hypothetical protein